MPVAASYPGGLSQQISPAQGAPGQDTVLVYKNATLSRVLLQTVYCEVVCPPSGASPEALFLRWKSDTGTQVARLLLFGGFPQGGGTVLISSALNLLYVDGLNIEVGFPPPVLSEVEVPLPDIVLEPVWSVELFMWQIQGATQITNVNATILTLDGGAQGVLTPEVPIYLVPEPVGAAA